MAFRMYTPEGYTITPAVRKQEHNPAKLLAYVGNAPKGKDAKPGLTGKVEREYRITDELLGYNAGKGVIFMRLEDNSRKFDVYVQMPFTKGVTDKKTGRTMLITGDWTHHGEAMQGQYDCDKEPYKLKDKGFGPVIRWVNIGVGITGFLGLDYDPKSQLNSGLARSLEEIQYLCKNLEGFGMVPEKPVRLLEAPYIKESLDGKLLREQHKLNTIEDWVKADVGKIHLRRQ